MRDEVKTDPKKNKGIMNLKLPTTTTEVNILLSMVQYYRDMWKSCSHILEPLTTASSGRCKCAKVIRNDDLERVFNDTKKIICEETILNQPDWELPFTTHTNASNKQLGSVISQNDKHITFFSRCLSKAQRNCTTTEKELLFIVEFLKQFK